MSTPETADDEEEELNKIIKQKKMIRKIHMDWVS